MDAAQTIVKTARRLITRMASPPKDMSTPEGSVLDLGEGRHGLGTDDGPDPARLGSRRNPAPAICAAKAPDISRRGVRIATRTRGPGACPPGAGVANIG
jgi:hypothetical protein